MDKNLVEEIKKNEKIKELLNRINNILKGGKNNG